MNCQLINNKLFDTIPQHQYHGYAYLRVVVFDYDNNVLKTIDTSQYNWDRYSILVFDYFNWKKIQKNGLVDLDEINCIAVIFDFAICSCYIQYQFLNQNKQMIFSYRKNHYIAPKQNLQLKQCISIPQLITRQTFVINNQKTQEQYVLCWERSKDKDNIVYEIQIFDQENNILYSDVIENNYFNVTFLQNNGILQKQSIYKYRVRSKDQIDCSQWSQFYYFKIINCLYQSILIQNRSNLQLFSSIYLLPTVQDLKFSIRVQPRFSSIVGQSVFIKPLLNSQLSFGVVIKQQQIRHSSNLFQSLYVDDSKYRLKMNLIIAKKCFQQLFQSLYVKDDNYKLDFNTKVDLTLIQKLWCNGVYQNSMPIQAIQLYYSFAPLNQSIVIQRRFSNIYNDVIYQQLEIGKLKYNPIQLKFFDSNNIQIAIDNRINAYNQYGQKITVFDQNGIPIVLYPYVDGKKNQLLIKYDENKNTIYQYSYNEQLIEIPYIFDINGNVIQKLYDINGNLIQVYNQNNRVDSLLPHGRYRIQYTSYSNGYITYLYNIGLQQELIPNISNKLSYVDFNANYTGRWNFVVRAIKNGENIHEYDSKQYFIINKKPLAVTSSIYIDGQLMNNTNIINNSNPTFSFYGVRNDDVDLLRYSIQISKTDVFNQLLVDQEILYSSERIQQTLLPKNYLIDEGYYYLRIATYDYQLTNDIYQRKTASFSTVYRFLYNHYQMQLFGKLQRVNVSWYLLGQRLQLRGWQQFYQKINVCKFLDGTQFQNKLYLYKNKVVDNEIPHSVIIRGYTDQFQQKLLLTQNHATLYQGIVIYMDYSHLEEDKIPQNHYLYGQCIVYKHRFGQSNDSIEEVYLPGINLIHRYQKSTFNSKIIVQRRFDSIQLVLGCRVWNVFHYPYEKQLKGVVSIANIIHPIAWLYQQIQVIYPPPPSAVIVSNLPKEEWQNNYNAQFVFSVIEDTNISILGYYYVVDRNANTIPTLSNSNFSNGDLRIDLRDIGDGKITGKVYVHVRAINSKMVLSQDTAHYGVFYNNRVQPPIPISVNNNLVNSGQVPVIRFNYSIYFYWTLIIDAVDVIDSITYDLQISTDSNFNQLVLDYSKIVGNYYNVPPKSLNAGKYYWRVRAYDGNQYSDWSFISAIYINKAPQSPTKLSVKNYF